MSRRSVTYALESRLQPEQSRWSFGRLKAGLQRRAGATLTEVLMSLLIMSVGIVSVFTLFPISVLRTIQATNQTNAKFLKENTEELVSQSPVLLTGFTAVSPANPLTGTTMYQGEWQAGFAYPANSVIVPTIKAGSTVPRPLAFFGTAGGTSGLAEPIWNANGPTTDGGVTWSRLPLDRYVVDPLGWTTAGGDGLTAIQDFFGNKTDQTGAVPPTPSGLLRIHGSLNTPFLAIDTCTHPDSWQQVLEATPTFVDGAANSVTFPPTVDLSGIGGSILTFPRIVLTSSDGRQTVVRDLNTPSLSGSTVNWSSTEPLPVSFQRPPGSLQFDVGLARIEVFNRRYAWFLTVRNVGARPEIKCVVTFNRGFNTAEEHAYATNFGNPDIDLNLVNGADVNDGLVNNNQVMVAWQPDGTAGFDPEGTGDVTNEPDPLLKPGNWLFDARDASWYRIQSVDNESALSATPRWAVLSLDRTVRVVTPDDGAGPPSAATPIGRAILMPGIVEVFDL